ncbi:DUF6316 family protein [Aliikangiella sp. IMCC44359]|uniref:DUF6316 family protein n=1 Tax=Aliikangiella sp. IMCC44359 TaxID=3459125 RepID=UPI00403B2351
MPSPTSPYIQRYGETLPEFNRSGRFFCESGNWYFKTREGINYGPYTSKTECKYAYQEFIDIVNNHNDLGGIEVEYDDSEKNWTMPKINFN